MKSLGISGIAIGGTSLPVWGEWIEIDMHVAAYARNRVSPRVGRVD